LDFAEDAKAKKATKSAAIADHHSPSICSILHTTKNRDWMPLYCITFIPDNKKQA
jgi:hypothetical protein